VQFLIRAGERFLGNILCQLLIATAMQQQSEQSPLIPINDLGERRVVAIQYLIDRSLIFTQHGLPLGKDAGEFDPVP
jgi:hypothetical protein